MTVSKVREWFRSGTFHVCINNRYAFHMFKLRSAGIASAIFLLFFMTLSMGCKDPLKPLKDQVRGALKDNIGIDPAEFASIQSLINSDQNLHIRFSDTLKIKAYIDEIAKEMSRQRPPINYPVTITITEKAPVEIAYQIYYENSASMDGYLNGKTEFKDALLTLLATIKLKNHGIELFYINTEAYSADSLMPDFQKYLQPDIVRKFGNRGNSQINRLISIVADSVIKAENKVAVVISDYIYSIQGKNVRGQLGMQKTTTALALGDLAKKDFAVMLVNLESLFDGRYYTMENKPVQIREQRPVYLWVMGPKVAVCDFSSKFRVTELAGYKQQLVILRESEDTHPYYTVLNETKKVGTFISSDRAQTQTFASIKELAPDRNGQFQFSVCIDFSAFPVDAVYIRDLDNYSIISNQGDKFRIIAVDTILNIAHNDKNQKGTANYILSIAKDSEKITKGKQELTLSFKKSIPGWIYEVSTESDITNEEREGKTFGFSYLVEGIAMAYDYNKESVYFKLPLTIEN